MVKANVSAKTSDLVGIVIHTGKGLCRKCYAKAKARAKYGWIARASAVTTETGMICCRCNEDLPLESFEVSAECRTGYRSTCKSCAYLSNYNITKADYVELLKKQDGCCAICRRHEDLFTRRLCIDHDHSCCPANAKSCGKCIRGILCPPCNQALGLLLDDESSLKRAIEYLKDWK
jgi:hypothetical protein